MNATRKLLALTGLVLWITVPISAQVSTRELGSLVLEDVPDIPAEVRDRLRQYQSVRSAGFAGWDQQGDGIYISTRFAEVSQAHYVAQPGGARQQLTFFDEPVGSIRIRPAGQPRGFLFTKDVGGSEFYQIFYFDESTGQATMLTDGRSRNSGPLWSRTGDRFAYQTTLRNGRDYDIWVGKPENPPAAVMVMEGEGAWRAVEWSPDETQLLVSNYISVNESYIWILDLASGEKTQINPAEKNISYGGLSWGPDGEGVYYTSDEGGEFRQLYHHNLDSGEKTLLTGDIPWDIAGFELSHKGDMLALIINEGGIFRMDLRRIKGFRMLPLPKLPIGRVSGVRFSPDDRLLGFSINTSQTPTDTYSLDIRRRKLTRWTTSEVGGLDTHNFSVPELISYPTFDEVDGKPRMIPAFVYRPTRGEGPFPVIIQIHGGPEGQTVPTFSSTYQYWVNELGAVVIRPNVRGSNGYGKSYLLLDNGYKREESVQDIGALLDWIAHQPDLDADRVGVYGGSYGGYMVLASMTHFNDRIRAAVDIVGISNFVTFLENTQAYRRDLRRAEYGDERGAEMRTFLKSISPNTRAHQITKPMFIAAGLNDPRVPATESAQMVNVMRQNGQQVWYMLAKDEGHGFRKKSNSDFFREATVLFWQTHLLE